MTNNTKKTGVSFHSDPYCPENIPFFEAIYGKNLISLGGFSAIDNMFSDLNIKELKALDIGFGLGGVAFYLAEQYQMAISGVEIYPWMVEYAQSHAPKTTAHLLNFNVYNINNELPYEAESFDLVYSKGVLNHVRDKETLFRQVNTVLKSNGLFVIADWIFPHNTKSNSGPLVNETKKSYEKALNNAGFHAIQFRDDSKIFLDYAKTLLENLTHHQIFIEQAYGKELFSMTKQQHKELIDNIKHNRKCAVRIVARKNSK